MGGSWTAEVVITPSQGPSGGTISALAFDDGRLALVTSTSSDPEVIAHVYRFGGAGWSAETKLAAPQSPEVWPFLPRVQLSDRRVFVTTGELHVPIDVGSTYVFWEQGAWYEEARLRVPIFEGSSCFTTSAVAEGELLALVQPCTEPYFERFERYVLDDMSSSTSTPLPNPCADGACDDDIAPVAPAADDERADGCGCTLPTGGSAPLAGLPLALLLAAPRRPRRSSLRAPR